MKHYNVRNVAERYGLSPFTVWRKTQKDPEFPKPVKLSAKCTRWIESELDAYDAKLQSKRESA